MRLATPDTTDMMKNGPSLKFRAFYSCIRDVGGKQKYKQNVIKQPALAAPRDTKQEI